MLIRQYCCGIAYDSSVSLVHMLWEGFVHCIVGVSREVCPQATLVIVVKHVERGRARQTMLNEYPKDLSVKLL